MTEKMTAEQQAGRIAGILMLQAIRHGSARRRRAAASYSSVGIDRSAAYMMIML